MIEELSFKKYKGEHVIVLITGEAPIEGELVGVGEELIELKERAILKKKKIKGLRKVEEDDIDRVITGISSEQETRIMKIREIIKNLEEKIGEEIPIQKIIDKAKDEGIEEEKVEEALDKMEREGEIFEPRRGVIKRVIT